MSFQAVMKYANQKYIEFVRYTLQISSDHNIIFFDQNNIKNITVKRKTQKIDGGQIEHGNQSFG